MDSVLRRGVLIMDKKKGDNEFKKVIAEIEEKLQVLIMRLNCQISGRL